MTCKDCIHYNVCEYHADGLRAEGFIVDFDNRSDAEKSCCEFKQKQEWISVDERLPDRDGKYLVYTSKGFIFTQYYYCTNAVGFETWDVTHWMPLPETPKKGDKTDA